MTHSLGQGGACGRLMLSLARSRRGRVGCTIILLDLESAAGLYREELIFMKRHEFIN